MSVMLTGANGFVGRALTTQLLLRGYDIVAPLRQTKEFEQQPSITVQKISEFDKAQLTTLDFTGVSCVIHLAARAHVLADYSTDPLALFRKVNTEATITLARLAAAAGVKRFIFLSSIGVNGITSNKPFSELDEPAPLEDYAISKLEAEIGLRLISAETGMEVVIIRPPLVYGPAAPGNFGKLAKFTQRKLPLPLGAVKNKRSLIALDNLIDLISTCIEHPRASNQTFLVSDDHDVSTTELLQMMILATGNTPILIPVPVSWLKLAGKLLGKQAVVDRLCGNLQVDITHTKETLNWTPPITIEEGIRRCFVKEDLC